MVLGFNANVGIGTSTPGNKLEVVSSTTGSSGLRLTNLTSVVSTTYTTNKFLMVTSAGDVVLAQSGTPNVRVSSNCWRRNRLIASPFSPPNYSILDAALSHVTT